MTYPETLQYLESFIDYEKVTDYPYKESVKLERVKDFLSAIGSPQENLKCLHIAGTKGKGSTCAFIAYILRDAGYSVGLYTSPHLSDFRERIRILTPGSKLPTPDSGFEGMISEGELAALIEKLMPAIEVYNHKSKYGRLSFFEVYTSLAFSYFKEKGTDFAVLETGMGGRLDATNVVDSLVAAITPVSYEHTQKLGNTLREIATEKAGIIKKCQSAKVPKCHGAVICAPQEKEAISVIRGKCKETGAELYEVGQDIIYKKTKDGFSVQGISREYAGLKIKLLGEHQIINATVAVGAIEALRPHNININAETVSSGLYNTAWPGRCEIISRSPLLILDGAQNLASMRALKKTIKENFKYKRLILILGISSDKDIKGICGELYDLADIVILTRADNPRAASPRDLAGYFDGKRIYITDSVAEAKKVSGDISKGEDLILVCGSLFVVGEFKNA